MATPEFSVDRGNGVFPSSAAWRTAVTSARRAPKLCGDAASEGWDTIVGGVPAYSTLGKFDDPILNTMMIYGDDELASIMFHELSHQLVYIQDDTAFNEAFAVTVEQEGLARWLKFHGREADLAKYQKRRARQREGVALVARFRGELHALYGMNIGPEVMRARKAQVFARLVAELRALDVRFGTESASPRNSMASPTTPAWLRSPPTTTAYRDSSGCWPGSNATCRASTLRCARWPNYLATSDEASCAAAHPVHQVELRDGAVRLLGAGAPQDLVGGPDAGVRKTRRARRNGGGERLPGGGHGDGVGGEAEILGWEGEGREPEAAWGNEGGDTQTGRVGGRGSAGRGARRGGGGEGGGVCVAAGDYWR